MSLVERTPRQGPPGPDDPGPPDAGPAGRPRADVDIDLEVDLLFAPIEPVSERVAMPAFGTGRRTESRRGRRRSGRAEPEADRVPTPVPPSRPVPTRADVAAWFGERPGRAERLPRPSRRAKAVLTPARRRRLTQRLRRAAALALVVAVLVVLVAVGRGRPDGLGLPGSPRAAVGAPVDAPTLTLVSVADADAGTAEVLTLLVRHPDGGGGLVYVPTGAMVEIPSFGLERLGDAAGLGGTDLVRTGLENLFGVQVHSVVDLSAAQLGALVPAEVVVDLAEPVEVLDDRGRVDVLWPAGPVRLLPADVERFLTVQGDESELGVLVRHQAFWSAVLHQARAGATPGGPLGDALAALASGDVTHHTLPAESLGADDTGVELYKVDRAATAALVEQVMPGARPAEAAERTRVQLLNGTGEPGQARAVTAALVPAGAQVVVVGNADRFDHDVTQVVFYDKGERRRAEAVRDALGVGEVVFSRNRLDVVDITVVVGSDFTS